MSKTYYMGSFPPPYGGVTLKNELLYNVLKDNVDMRIKKKFTLISTFEALCFGSRFILGVGHTKFLLLLSRCMAVMRPKAMRRSIVFAMGGNLADMVEGKQKYIESLQHYRQIFVEPQGLLRRLQSMGLKNVSLLPNCRERPTGKFEPTDSNTPIKCVFFSRVTPGKGVDHILAAAKMLPTVQIDFYGPIDEKYANEFIEEINAMPNAAYRGLFKERGDALYQMLHAYDVMLLPSKWAFEGIPGALVEAKIAALPAIVSNICYNAEIVEDNVSGLVLKENTPAKLAEAIQRLERDPALVYSLKCGAKKSAEGYYIDQYTNEIRKYMEV